MGETTDFTGISNNKWLYESSKFFVVEDKYPVSPGHLLIISKQNRKDFFDLNEDERSELTDLIFTSKEILEENYNPDGYNIGMNCGKSAGQTIFHFHCHVIPRYEGDMDNPSGGIRHCVEGKGYYHK